MERTFGKGFSFILLITGFIWLRSGIGKIVSGAFTSTLSTTLGKFATHNPYPWYKYFLLNILIPNASVIGTVTMWLELLTGIALVAGTVYYLIQKSFPKDVTIGVLLGCVGGMFLNLNFYFATSWTSSSTESLNMLMFFIEFIGVFVMIGSIKN